MWLDLLADFLSAGIGNQDVFEAVALAANNTQLLLSDPESLGQESNDRLVRFALFRRGLDGELEPTAMSTHDFLST